MPENPTFPESLMESLSAMPGVLLGASRRIPPERWSARPAGGGFSLTEQSWHLADLEREGFGARIARILSEIEPELADFDGARIARERGYASRRFEDGLKAFAIARRENISRLATVSAVDFDRTGHQDGVGIVRLADVPRLMNEHDASHRAEIVALMNELGSTGNGGLL